MKREELEALELTSEQVNAVMKLYGKSVTELQSGLSAAQADSESAKAELKKYQKNGELYIDGEEYQRLKSFEKDTIEKADKDKKTDALTKLFKGANASDSATKLLIKGTDFAKIEFDEKGEIKGGADILKQAKADYADLFAANGNSGVPQTPDGEGGAPATKRAKFY
jgi:hypothetical protein